MRLVVCKVQKRLEMCFKIQFRNLQTCYTSKKGQFEKWAWQYCENEHDLRRPPFSYSKVIKHYLHHACKAFFHQIVDFISIILQKEFTLKQLQSFANLEIQSIEKHFNFKLWKGYDSAKLFLRLSFDNK